MNSLPEIEQAIMRLSKDDIYKLSDWLQTYLNNSWDRQIEADAKSGRLDKLLQQVNKDIDNNRVKLLDEILYDS